MKKNIVRVLGIGAAVVAVAGGVTLYQSESQQYVSRDASQNAADLVNTVSCTLFNTAVDQELKAATESGSSLAPYAVHFDKNACRAGTASSDPDKASSTPLTPMWVIPAMGVNGVLHVDWYEYGDRTVFGQADIYAGRSSEHPFGVWKANLCAEYLASEMTGKTGDAACAGKLFAEVNDRNEYSVSYERQASGTSSPWNKNYLKYARGYIQSDEKAGYGSYFEKVGVANPSQGYYGFKDSALKINANGAASCKLPKQTGDGVLRTVWDAWLYDSTTKERMSIPNGPRDVFRVADKASGRLTNEGVRLDGSATTETAGQFKLVGDTSGNVYTATGTFGKLIKKTPQILTEGLTEIDMLTLRFKLRKANFSSWLNNPLPNVVEQYALGHWDQANQKFVFTHIDNSTTGLSGKSFKSLTSPQQLSKQQLLDALRANNRNWERRLWTYLIGSNYEYVIQLADNGVTTLKSTTDVIRITQKTVVPGSADAPASPLACLGRCLVDDGTHSEVEMRVVSAGQTSSDMSLTDFAAAETYHYGSDGSLKTTTTQLPISYLKSNGDDVNRNGVDTTRSDLYLGDFFEATAQNLNALKCRSGASYCAYDTTTRLSPANGETFGVLGLQHYYSWNTGPERWQRFSGLVNSAGEYQYVSDPLTVFLNVPNEVQEYGDYAGQKVALRYAGAGQLWLPGRCVNTADATRLTSDACSDTNEVWIHNFVIPTDELSGRVTDLSGNVYLAKWLRQGVYFANQASTVCDSPDVNNMYQSGMNTLLPDGSDWTNPRSNIGPNLPTNATPNEPKYKNAIKVSS